MKTKLLLALFLTSSLSFSQTVCTAGFAGTFPCNMVDLMANLTPAQIGGTSNTQGNDCWGWTDPLTNKEYALMGCTSHTAFVDITNPAAPIYLGKVVSTNGVNSLWRDIKVYNNYAFIVSEATGHGMQVFDLTRLRNQTAPQTFTPDAHYTGFGRCHNIAINEATGFAYCIGSNTFSGGAHVVNIQNPLNPVLALGYSAQGYTHDAQIVTYNGPDTAHVGKELFFGCNEDKVVIVDMTNKANPVLLSTFTYSNTAYTHQGWLTPDHKYFIIGDELDESNFGFNTRSIVINVSDIDNPVLNFNYTGTSPAIDHNGYTKGSQFHLASYRAGYRIMDMTNIETGSMNEVGFFDTYPASNSAQFNGAWSVYPYFPSGNIIVSDIERGLFVLRLQSPLLNNQQIAKNKVALAPNPANDLLTITSEVEMNTIQVFDTLGKTIYTTNLNNTLTATLDVSQFQKGLYFVKVNDLQVQKLMVN
ncbi:choice-of-anchor B family protein [Flavobacterium capsici]|uniref:Choice-of-anchor B family protein n=1 Tax=Flavobacterium capsici TaxID=3075618 RepID=A0AA96F375_9FLAO|nr:MULTISPECIES: choice-of-anchor B family protein [unclassified Flavobacterium]WNM18708.1 choice-of-anchor B family protein [Flavobacterium sp. PMR2A8]WNM22759.1 choice-of-anchor B family protein [Flavobacterium sp. PMTSA4]